MRIIVAGSNGFLGRNFKKNLSLDPSVETSFLSRSDIDLTNSDQLSDYCRLFKPDLLIHVAVSLVDFTNNLLMYYALEQCSPFCGKIIMIGSGAEYSHQRYKPLMPETYFDPYSPPLNHNIYHISKHLISRLHCSSAFSNIYNFRVFGLYGPYEDYTRRLISNNIFNFLEEGEMSASVNHSFDYLYVDDLISAVLHFANHSQTPLYNTYNLCTGRADSFYDILSEVIRALGGSESMIKMDSLEHSGFDYSGDNIRFQSEFNYIISQTTYSESAILLENWLTSEVLHSST